MYFYSGKVPIHLHYMAYVIGFINGVCQSYAVDQELQGDLVVRFVKAFDKTVKNHTKALNIPDYPKSFEDLFMERWASKEFMTDEDASSEFLLGMAEGKEWADADRLIQEDYSKLKDQAVVQNLNLNGFREYINGWKLELMANDEAMALISMPINWTEEQIDEELRRRGLL